MLGLCWPGVARWFAKQRPSKDSHATGGKAKEEQRVHRQREETSSKCRWGERVHDCWVSLCWGWAGHVMYWHVLYEPTQAPHCTSQSLSPPTCPSCPALVSCRRGCKLLGGREGPQQPRRCHRCCRLCPLPHSRVRPVPCWRNFQFHARPRSLHMLALNASAHGGS